MEMFVPAIAFIWNQLSTKRHGFPVNTAYVTNELVTKVLSGTSEVFIVAEVLIEIVSCPNSVFVILGSKFQWTFLVQLALNLKT
jgi:hypothetical protein